MNCRLKGSNLKNGEVLNILGQSRSRKYAVRWENGETIEYFSRGIELYDDNNINILPEINQEVVAPHESESSESNDDFVLNSVQFNDK